MDLINLLGQHFALHAPPAIATCHNVMRNIQCTIVKLSVASARGCPATMYKSSHAARCWGWVSPEFEDARHTV